MEFIRNKKKMKQHHHPRVYGRNVLLIFTRQHGISVILRRPVRPHHYIHGRCFRISHQVRSTSTNPTSLHITPYQATVEISEFHVTFSSPPVCYVTWRHVNGERAKSRQEKRHATQTFTHETVNVPWRTLQFTRLQDWMSVRAVRNSSE